jgi:uncharacterized protein with PQ loop repeat
LAESAQTQPRIADFAERSFRHGEWGLTQRVLSLGVVALGGCERIVRDAPSLLSPRFHRSEIFGFVAGFGTTFAAVPDLLAMLKRRSSKGMNPTMAGIMGVFQIAWVYYGLLILSRPVIAWNLIAVVINFLSVAAYARFARLERNDVDQSNRTRGRP